MHVFLEALWIALPVIVGGALHITAIRKNVLPALAEIPLDAGMTWRGRRVFGANKTLRGALLMIAFTTLSAVLQAWIASRFAWARDLTPPELTSAGPLVWGALLGAGYVIGELPNSLLKRQIDIAPGAAGSGALGPAFWIIDQVDSLLGALVAMSFVWLPPWP
ncbi:MAG: CDP-archaeol synthase, partial [Acidobacteria bacterium]